MIEIRNACKRYGRITAVQGIDLSIPKGETFGLLGPNGAGKTTLIRLLATLARPDEGRLGVGGFDTLTQARAARRLLGVVFQENNLDRELTAFQNLVFHARLHRLDRAKERVEAMLGRLGLAERAHQQVNRFSGGMRRRLVIGRALLTKPSVLLLDEPTTGLDPAIRRDLWELVREIGREGCTIVLTTHYIEEAEALCGRVGIINHGKLAALGTPDELVSRFGASKLEDVVVALGAGG